MPATPLPAPTTPIGSRTTAPPVVVAVATVATVATTANVTTAVRIVATPPFVDPIGKTPKLTGTPTTDATQVGTSFIRAALDANEPTLRALTHPSYAHTAVTLWINGAGPTGQAIIATKAINQSAGHARIAVFVDSNDLTIAALPFTVDLLQNPATNTWTVIDAGLALP
jgi:hypothetical protein